LAPFSPSASQKAVTGAAIVDRLGLERLAVLALEDERESPSHLPHPQRSAIRCDHDPRIAGIDRVAGIAGRVRERAEQPRHLLDGLRHLVEIAHGSRTVAQIILSYSGLVVLQTGGCASPPFMLLHKRARCTSNPTK
jgi:hypothetical protein